MVGKGGHLIGVQAPHNEGVGGVKARHELCRHALDPHPHIHAGPEPFVLHAEGVRQATVHVPVQLG